MQRRQGLQGALMVPILHRGLSPAVVCNYTCMMLVSKKPAPVPCPAVLCCCHLLWDRMSWCAVACYGVNGFVCMSGLWPVLWLFTVGSCSGADGCRQGHVRPCHNRGLDGCRLRASYPTLRAGRWTAVMMGLTHARCDVMRCDGPGGGYV